MPDFRDFVTIPNVLVIAQTDKAIRIRMDDGEEKWIPQSQIDDRSEVYKNGDEGDLIISEWFASKEGIS